MESPGRGCPMRWQIGLAIVATVAACGKKADDGAEPSPLVPVGIGTVAQDTISQVITLTGRLMPLPGGSALLSAPADAMVRDGRGADRRTRPPGRTPHRARRTRPRGQCEGAGRHRNKRRT